MSNTIWGMPIIRSTSQLTAASAQRARAPRGGQGKRNERRCRRGAQAHKHACGEAGEVRQSMSRPIQSVPKGCASDGPPFFAAKSVAWAAGSSKSPRRPLWPAAAPRPRRGRPTACGWEDGPSAPQRAPAPQRPPRSVRGDLGHCRLPSSSEAPRAAGCGRNGWRCRPHARVNQAVDEVGGQVAREDDGSGHERDAASRATSPPRPAVTAAWPKPG